MYSPNTLVQISIVCCMIHMYIFMLLFYEYRCSKRTFILSGTVVFLITSGICYLILVMLSVYPTVIFDRPKDIPLTVVVLALIALSYGTIFRVLFEQLHVFEAQERQQILEAQAAMMSRRMGDIRRAEAAMRIERHDMRHQLQTVASLAQRGDCAALLDYVGASQEKLDDITPKSYCSNAVLDTVLVNAAEQAEQMGIAAEMAVALPEKLPADVLELSIVFANALENAIQAVRELPDGQRRIICKSVTHPRFLMEFSNPYAGEISFDRRGCPLPISRGMGSGPGASSPLRKSIPRFSCSAPNKGGSNCK